MIKSFNNEVPPARINITLDVSTGDATVKRELPLKLLVLGDFSGGKSVRPIAERQRYHINQRNINQVLNALSPTLRFTVPNKISQKGDDIDINLSLEGMTSFLPNAVIDQVPELRALLAMRLLLKELKSNVANNRQLRVKLQQLVQDRAALVQLATTIKGERHAS